MVLVNIISMESALENINLDISLMLISWGLMTGKYQDGVIKASKFGILNMLFAFILFTFEAIKFTILMFSPEQSQLAIYLGEFMQYFGPKIIIDFLAFAEAVNSIMLIATFYLLSNKMLLWLDHLEFNAETRCFHKLNLSVSDSERFTKRFSLLWFIIKWVNYFLISATVGPIMISFLTFKRSYYLYYFTSISLFSISLFYLINHWASLTLVFYQVKIN